MAQGGDKGGNLGDGGTKGGNLGKAKKATTRLAGNLKTIGAAQKSLASKSRTLPKGVQASIKKLGTVKSALVAVEQLKKALARLKNA